MKQNKIFVFHFNTLITWQVETKTQSHMGNTLFRWAYNENTTEKDFIFIHLLNLNIIQQFYSFSQPLKIKTRDIRSWIRMKKQGHWSEYIHRNWMLRDHLEENKIKVFNFAPRLSDIQQNILQRMNWFSSDIKGRESLKDQWFIPSSIKDLMMLKAIQNSNLSRNYANDWLLAVAEDIYTNTGRH